MNAILVSDLHLTSNPRDEYRWALFPWLIEMITKHSVRNLFILGDTTDAKDYHSSRLVNRVVSNVLSLYQQTELHRVHILRGNHDGIDPACPYFQFLGKFPSIQYISTPFAFPLTIGTQADVQVQMLPHTANPEQDWEAVQFQKADLILAHATFKGAVAENGQALEGVPVGLLAKAHRAKIYSGDIHVPQTIAKGFIEYVGAPYAVRFGDDFTPRAVLLEGVRKARDLSPPGVKRRILAVNATDTVLRGLEGLSKGDQVKVRLRLAPAEFMDWQKRKKWVMGVCAEAGVELCGLELERVPEKRVLLRRPVQQAQQKTPLDIFKGFCEGQKLDKNIVASGQEFLRIVK